MEYAVGFVNARGTALVVCLHDIPNRVREVALHGVRHGAAMALAAAQAPSGHKLRLLPHGFPATEHPGDHECLVEDFFNTANSLALTSHSLLEKHSKSSSSQYTGSAVAILIDSSS